MEKESKHNKGLNKFTKEYSSWGRDELAEKIIFYRAKKDELTTDQIRKKINKAREKFYEEQDSLYEEFEFDLLTGDRSIEELSKKHEVLFVHTLPVFEHKKANTSMNNNVSPEQMTTEEKIDALINLSPTISASAIKPKDGKFSTMYPFGLVIKRGTVLSAYKYDAGTLAEGVKKRKSKYDPETQGTSVQRNIERKVELALGGVSPNRDDYTGFNQKKDMNEFVVEDPEFSALYVNMDFPYIDLFDREEMIKIISKKYPNLPVVFVERGQVSSLEDQVRQGSFDDLKRSGYESPKNEEMIQSFEKGFGTIYFLYNLFSNKDAIVLGFSAIEDILTTKNADSFSFLGEDGYHIVKDKISASKETKEELIAFLKKYSKGAKESYRSKRMVKSKENNFENFVVLKKQFDEWRKRFKEGIRGLSSSFVKNGDLEFGLALLKTAEDI